MEVRIGVTWSNRELEVDLGDGADGAEVTKQIEASIAAGTVLWLTDKKGKKVGVPADKVAYVEIGKGDTDRKVGFGLG